MQSETFRDFEHSGWQNVADPYHDYFSSLTMQTIDSLLDAVDAKTGTKLLDVATGPGYVAARAKQRGALVEGIDFSSVMVTMAAQLYPDIQFKEGDAENLPCADESFDAVTMNFGLLHLDKPEQAVKESFRVLKKQGRFAFSVWCESTEAAAFGIVLKAVEENGNSKVALPQGPPFFRFSNPEESTRVLQSAGFFEVQVKKIPMWWHLDSESDFFDAFYLGTPRTGGLLRAQAPADLAAIKNAIFEALKPYAINSGIRIPMASIVVSGCKH